MLLRTGEKICNRGREQILTKNQISSYAFNIKIACRILSILVENGRINRTNLAGKSGLNYNRCVKYTEILLRLGWARIIFDDSNYLAITNNGLETMNKLSGVLI